MGKHCKGVADVSVLSAHVLGCLEKLVALALNTTLRKNKVRTLRWRQIDLMERTPTVGHSKTEGGGGTVIPLNPIAYGAAVRWAGRFPEAKAGHFLFPVCEAAEIEREHPDLAWREFRHRRTPLRPAKGGQATETQVGPETATPSSAP